MTAELQLLAPVITVDGPSGVGKGTVGWRLAQKKGWHFLDSGALYRVFAYWVHKQRLPLDPDIVLHTIEKMPLAFVTNDKGVWISLEGQDVTASIRSEECGKWASELASIPAVRTGLLASQRRFRKSPGLIADGRDMGTTVFPDACAKFYLTASLEERARRRFAQLKRKGEYVSLQSLLDDLRVRDARDMGRRASPLKPAADACIIDTTDLDADSVLERMESFLAQAMLLS